MWIFQDPDIVRVTIAHVRLEADAPILNNDAIQMLFVEYRFLGVPLEETETPFSLPKPKPDTQIAFNFTKGGYNANDFKLQCVLFMLKGKVVEENILCQQGDW